MPLEATVPTANGRIDESNRLITPTVLYAGSCHRFLDFREKTHRGAQSCQSRFPFWRKFNAREKQNGAGLKPFDVTTRRKFHQQVSAAHPIEK